MEFINHYFNDLHEALSQIDRLAIAEAITQLQRARQEQRTVFILGNGGSASTAAHFACDLGKNTRVAGLPPFRVMCLADNMATLSAYANDEGYENVFVQQLASFCRPGDVVIAISTSGRSPNVLRAVELANELGAHTIGMTGFNGGDLHEMVDLELHVPSHCIEQVEDAHLILEHLITKALREAALETLAPAGEESLLKAWNGETRPALI